jgi:hypothetical protein
MTKLFMEKEDFEKKTEAGATWLVNETRCRSLANRPRQPGPFGLRWSPLPILRRMSLYTLKTYYPRRTKPFANQTTTTTIFVFGG